MWLLWTCVPVLLTIVVKAVTCSIKQQAVILHHGLLMCFYVAFPSLPFILPIPVSPFLPLISLSAAFLPSCLFLSLSLALPQLLESSYGVWGRCKVPKGSGRSPSAKRLKLVHSRAEISAPVVFTWIMTFVHFGHILWGRFGGIAPTSFSAVGAIAPIPHGVGTYTIASHVDAALWLPVVSPAEHMRRPTYVRCKEVGRPRSTN